MDSRDTATPFLTSSQFAPQVPFLFLGRRGFTLPQPSPLRDHRRHTESDTHNGHFTLTARVWVDGVLLYEAIGAPMGRAPKGDDVQDLQSGIPDSVFDQCERCHRGWKWVRSHATYYDAKSGFDPLCESCWKALTPAQRLPFYRSAWNGKKELAAGLPGAEAHVAELTWDWPALEKAVLAGK
jgi:hypothetical protein